MYQLSRTGQVNDDVTQPLLKREDVWSGLLLKANNALPYVPQMQRCIVIERGDGWLVRDILVNNVEHREKVVFEPGRRVIFDRIGGPEPGRIENILDEDAAGNLTLTFSFALSKSGLAEGSAAEAAHFAPMEAAYFGAVAATLAAVRKTVKEGGAEALQAHTDLDCYGEVQWMYEYFAAVDNLDLERLLALHTDDTSCTFCNAPTASGKAAMRRMIGGLWQRIQGMSHRVIGAWSLHHGRVGIAELAVTYTRLDNTQLTIKACTILRRNGDLIADLRIHMDLNDL